ncbi:MAG: hypothetical protein ACLGG7_04835 [Bacteriovoracia bacterium]
MSTHTKQSSFDVSSFNDLGSRLSSQISERYDVDQRLASEMAWDLLELMAAVDSDLDTLDRYYLK